MAGPRASLEFDEIATAYDATREPLDPGVQAAIVSHLETWGAHRVLEVGVGTGRVAAPLSQGRFEITGIDASRGMLAQARQKGLRRLVRGSAYRLPLADRCMDVALFVHVLHVLDEPAIALGEACRVARLGAAALVRPHRGDRGQSEGRLRPRRLVYEFLREEGVQVPERVASGGPNVAEPRLLAEYPPDSLETISEEDVTEPLADELKLFDRRASRWTLHVPPDQLARAVARAREALGERTHTYHRVRSLARWTRPPALPGSVRGPRPDRGTP